MSRFDRDRYLRLIRGESQGISASLARFGLRLASTGYGAVIAARNLGFDRKWLTSHRASVPVVAVGNLTLGGTGKTPLVEWIAPWFRRRNIRVTILSRGYGKTEGLNDEGRVLCENLPDVPQLQDADRVGLAEIAVTELETEVIVLDDGFQHRRLARDLDIVLLDALDPFGLRRLFPRGLLREPVASLRRAGVVVLSRADLVSPAEAGAIRTEAERRAGRTLRWVENAQACADRPDRRQCREFAGFRPRRIFVDCGVLWNWQPGRFPPHHCPLVPSILGFTHLSRSPSLFVIRHCIPGAVGTQAGNATLVLTTQKDLVKLRTSLLGPIPLRALRIGLEITAGVDIMDDALARLLPG